MAKETVRVEGTDEAIKSFQDFGKSVTDKAALAEAGGDVLVPYIATISRYDTGQMAAGWGITPIDDGAAFINTQDYWTYQEFGTEDIEPMGAITQAWARREDAVVEAYNEALQKAADNAGF